MKDPNNCPYCESELQGHSRPWGMGPEGWNSMREKHEKEHRSSERDNNSI